MARLTVAQLVRALKKQPQTALVAFRCHDNGDGIDGYIGHVSSSHTAGFDGPEADFARARADELDGRHLVVLQP